MTTVVSFELAKLLKEKGFEQKERPSYLLVPFRECTSLDIFGHDVDKLGFGDRIGYYIPYKTINAPTIAEVVYWIYSKYDIWISLIPDSSSGHKLLDRKFSVSIFRFNMNLNVQAEILRKDKNILYFNLPENAFEYAIEYILNTHKPTS